MPNSRDLDDPNRFMNIGDINSERGLHAKRNLFVFNATVLLIHFNPSLKFNVINLFGLRPFADGCLYSYVGLLLTTIYLTIYWIIQYRLGYLAWREKFLYLSERTPISLYFGLKDKFINKPEHTRTRYLIPESDGYYITKIDINFKNKNTNEKMRRVSTSSVKFLRLQLIFYWFGVFTLTIMSHVSLINLLQYIFIWN